MLEVTRSDLKAEVEKLKKQMKQLEILPSDIEQFAKVLIDVPVLVCVCVRACVRFVRACICAFCACVCTCMHACMCVYDPFLVQVSCETWLTYSQM